MNHFQFIKWYLSCYIQNFISHNYKQSQYPTGYVYRMDPDQLITTVSFTYSQFEKRFLCERYFLKWVRQDGEIL